MHGSGCTTLGFTQGGKKEKRIEKGHHMAHPNFKNLPRIAKQPISYSDPEPPNPEIAGKKKQITPWDPTPNSLEKTHKILKRPQNIEQWYSCTVFRMFDFPSNDFRVGSRAVFLRIS